MRERRQGIGNLLNLDVVFRAFLGAGFAYMIYAALQMPETTFGRPAAYPLFVGVVGLALWFGQTVYQVLMAGRGKPQGRIYDIAFETANIEQRVVWLRTVWMFVILGSLLFGVWLLSFHVTIPLFLFLYLWLMGKTKAWTALLIAIAMLFPVAFLYGYVIHTAWPFSVLERALGVTFQDYFDALFRLVF